VDSADAARGNSDNSGYLSVALAPEPAKVWRDHLQILAVVDQPPYRRALDD